MSSLILATIILIAGVGKEPLPDGASVRLGTTAFRTDAKWFTTFALSPDGKYLAEAGPESVTVRELTTGRMVYLLKDPEKLKPVPKVDGHTGNISICFSPDSQRLVTSDKGTTVQLWEASSGKWLKAMTVPKRTDGREEKDYPIVDLRLCQSAKRIYVIRSGVYAYLLDPKEESWETSRIRNATDDVTAVSGNAAKIVTHYNCDALYEQCTVESAEPAFQCTVRGGAWRAALTQNGSHVAVGGYDLRLWDLKSGKVAEIVPEKFLKGIVRDLHFSPDGKTLYATADRMNQILCWDVATGEKLPALEIFEPSFFELTADGKQLVAVSQSVIRRIDTATLKEIPPPEGFTGSVAVALTADAKLAAVGDRAGVVRLYSTPFDGEPRTVRRSGVAVDGLEFSPDGATLYLGLNDYSLEIWNVAKGAKTATLSPPEKMPQSYYHAALRFAASPDGKLIVASAAYKAVWAWEAATGKIVWEKREVLEQKGDGVTDARPTFSKDGKTLFLGHARGQVGRYYPATGNEVGKRIQIPAFAKTGDDFYNRVAYRWSTRRLVLSPDGKSILIELYYNDARVYMIDLATDKAIWRTEFTLKTALHDAQFTSDGKTVLMTNVDDQTRSFVAATGKEDKRFRILPTKAGQFAMSSDGKFILAASGDATALVWKLTP